MAFQYKGDVGKDSVNALIALARSSGIPFTVTSTYRPGDPLYHGKHNAVDLSGTKVNMHQLAAYLYQYSPYLLELIHSNGSYFVSDGKRLATMDTRIVADHWDHVHLAATMSGIQAAGHGRGIPATGGKPVGCLPKMFGIIIATSSLCGGLLWMLN